MIALLELDFAQVVLGHQPQQVLDRAHVERAGRIPRVVGHRGPSGVAIPGAAGESG